VILTVGNTGAVGPGVGVGLVVAGGSEYVLQVSDSDASAIVTKQEKRFRRE
jgi:hypothetical protein